LATGKEVDDRLRHGEFPGGDTEQQEGRGGHEQERRERFVREPGRCAVAEDARQGITNLAPGHRCDAGEQRSIGPGRAHFLARIQHRAGRADHLVRNFVDGGGEVFARASERDRRRVRARTDGFERHFSGEAVGAAHRDR
jgi:hypothetical protein